MVWIFIALLLLVISVMLGSYFLGPQGMTKATKIPYESGIVSTGSARVKFPVHFYLIGMFFLIFDLESIFVYAWSTSIRELGWRGLAQISAFIGVLLLTLLYLLKNGALNLGPKLRQPGENP